MLYTSDILGVLLCKYRKDDNEVYKTHNMSPVSNLVEGINININTENNNNNNKTENLEICGVCGNPDITEEDDDSYFLNWIRCEVCFQWFHQHCLGCDIDTNDFVCSEECEINGLKKKNTNNNNKKTIKSNNSNKNITSNNNSRKNNNIASTKNKNNLRETTNKNNRSNSRINEKKRKTGKK